MRSKLLVGANVCYCIKSCQTLRFSFLREREKIVIISSFLSKVLSSNIQNNQSTNLQNHTTHTPTLKRWSETPIYWKRVTWVSMCCLFYAPPPSPLPNIHTFGHKWSVKHHQKMPRNLFLGKFQDSLLFGLYSMCYAVSCLNIRKSKVPKPGIGSQCLKTIRVFLSQWGRTNRNIAIFLSLWP